MRVFKFLILKHVYDSLAQHLSFLSSGHNCYTLRQREPQADLVKLLPFSKITHG